jgi:hypothetical protein
MTDINGMIEAMQEANAACKWADPTSRRRAEALAALQWLADNCSPEMVRAARAHCDRPFAEEFAAALNVRIKELTDE